MVSRAYWSTARQFRGYQLLLPAQAGGHTIILIQPGPNKSTRTYLDYPSVHHAMDGELRHPA